MSVAELSREAGKIDIFDLSAPHAAWKALREEAPVYHDPASGYWVVTAYDDIKAVFDDYQTFSAEIAQEPTKPLCDEAKRIIAKGGFTSGLSARMPPDHTRIRKVAQTAFGPRRFKSIEPKIEAIIDRTLNEAAELGQFDFFRQVAYPVPALVLFTMMGIPDEDVPKVKDWAVSRALVTWGDLSDEEQVVHAQGMVDYWAYCRALVDARRENPGDDFPSDLLKAQAEGADITDEEIAGLMYSTLFAGHETTTTLMSNAVITLMHNRDAWDAIREDPSLIPAATEEILRYSPSIVCWRRLAKADTQIGGVDVPAGAKILMAMGSGNRDESVFPGGEEFDIHRANARNHLTFGYGIHFCIGFQLAKMEFGIMLRELTKRFPNMTLTDGQNIDYLKNISFRVPLKVEVDLGLGG
ncbi:putative cytochrome P450 [Roseobacter sp. MED193]|uniref:cytochrome P450 n=1 Tax=Roseobacter sp. MED193 TaxID=314262 RepID=UPI000068E3FB|nr:cytochrome P450 [Roseobacter sp. MED193]EAQ43655.1 putative cytochrome P450 [Roseobacter sp. MED193]